MHILPPFATLGLLVSACCVSCWGVGFMSLVARLVSRGVRAGLCQSPQDGGLFVHFLLLDSPCVLEGVSAVAWMRESSARLFVEFKVVRSHVMLFDGRFVFQVCAGGDQAWWCDRRSAWFSAADFYALPDAVH